MCPLYDYRCEKCKRTTEGMRRVDERFDGPECYFCGEPTKLLLSPVHGIVKDPAVQPGKWRKP